MNKTFKAIFIVFLFLLFAPGQEHSLGLSDHPQSADLKSLQEFEKFVTEQMAFDKLPGLSVAFMKNNYIWAKGFGYSDLENMVPAKAESAYRLASITKTITAVAILQLVEAGKINLDAEVQAYVPYFPKKKWPVTIRQLLGHLGGISHYKNDALEGHIKEPKNTRQALAIFEDFDLVAEPGTRYNYSSYGFNLLGAVVEEVSGEPYDHYIKKHIFEPLGMDNSRLDNPVDLIPNRVRGYRIINGEIKNSEYVDVSSRFAGGGTRSTVVDLMKYALGIVSQNLLKEETWRKMFTSMATHNGYFTDYGLGWGVRPWKGHFQVSHGGSQPETRTHLLVFPAEKFAVAIAANLEDVNLAPYFKKLAENVLDEDLDSSAYAPNRNEQLIYSACEWTFSRGLSTFDWNGKILSTNDQDLAKAFAYFNACLDEKKLEEDFIETKKKILAGIHPVADQAFIKVGSFMASTLQDVFGREKLSDYIKRGPIAFFSDYIKISRSRPGFNKTFRFKNNLVKLITHWEKDWQATYTDYVRHLTITPITDFDEMEVALKKTFASSSLFADFSQDMETIAQTYLERKEPEKSFKILNICRDLYPNSPSSYAGLASAFIWTGNAETARQYYKKAFDLDPTHASLNPDQIRAIAGRLMRARKVKEALSLGMIALEFYPKNTRFLVEVGDLYMVTGQKEKAVELYKKALELDPDLETAKERLMKLKKEE